MEHICPSKLLCSMFLLIYIATSSSTVEERKTYIIHMDKSAMPSPFSTHHSWYTSTLASLSTTDGILPNHLYTYNYVMDGFSAELSRTQLDQLEKMPGHIATYPETFGQLHTTRTPKFLGLTKQAGLWPAAGFGDDMIIGIIDTGIWPEHKSFNDRGMPPVPERWRGACEIGMEFNSSYCNRKLIGARSFSKGLKQRGINISTPDDYYSPRDFFGHGTHTSSTAAGSQVLDADYFGYAKGTAIGVAPLARLAMYKTVFFNDTYKTVTSDTLAGMDQAIADGVDLMSLSLGFVETPFYKNPIALGAFAAMEKGIFVACSAGNSGPDAYSIFNGAPWITTVGAGTIDRDFVASVTLGEGVATIKGKSVFPEDLLVSGVPLYYGHGNRSKETCTFNTLHPKSVAGKIIFCDFSSEINVLEQILEVNRTGAAGAIISTDSAQFLQPPFFFIPFVAVSPKDGEVVKKYIIKSEHPPTVDIKFQITVVGTTPAPQVAEFSSRGPYKVAPWILKPDILAPGVDVLAAWVPNREAARIGNHYLLNDYKLLSGTSMSSPHVVGVAALLKAVHSDWSSAAIRSAMMTTADVVDNANGAIIDMTNGTAGTPLDFGGGHINPNTAMDPGLVYDMGVQDYINFLCALNYTSKEIRVITKRSNNTCEYANLDLNYPSFIVILNNTNTAKYTFKRVLTNVADSRSFYHAVVKAPPGMKVFVEPKTLSFGSKYSKAEFSMTVEIDMGDGRAESDYIGNYGYLNWYEVNGKHVVRSPIVSAFAP